MFSLFIVDWLNPHESSIINPFIMSETNVPGLFVVKDFLTQDEEEKLLEEINKCEWKPNRSGERRVQIYGPYHDQRYRIIPGKYSSHPDWVKKLAKKINNEMTQSKLSVSLSDGCEGKLLNEKTCEVYTNEYDKMDSLHYHFDHPVTYNNNIYGISLSSNASMGFKKGNKVVKVPVNRRSLYIMSGDSRTKYKHGIEKGWIEGKRVSVTFRTVR